MLMLNELIFIVEEAPEGGYVAKALGYSIYTEAETMEELKSNIKDAALCHFEEGKMPAIARIHFVKEETFALAG
jgi:hypothetical protein